MPGRQLGVLYCEACAPIETAERAARYDAATAHQARVDAETEASLLLALDRHAALSLRDHMSEISENCLYTEWIIGLEFELWQMLTDGARDFGDGEIDDAVIETLRRLSAACGGWWRWARDDDGQRFVPIAEWERIFGERAMP
jgi:hypothetical protein